MKFREEELKATGTVVAGRNTVLPMYQYPVSFREEWKKAILEKKPMWQNTGAELASFSPAVIPDNVARGFVFSGEKPLTDEEKGGKDMFGIEWVYVPVVGGSMEKPGNKHILEDANDWKENVVFPDIDSWDWEGAAAANKEFCESGKAIEAVMLNGFGFERLISFMGFENAAMALLDEDQEDALLELFDALSDLYCRIIDKFVKYFHVDSIQVHDDWGSQRSPFFSVEVGKKFLVPYMKKVVDHIHSYGLVANLHSCGCLEKQIGNFIEAGWDVWSLMTNINDTQKLFQEYGDKICIFVEPDPVDLEKDSEEVLRQKARDFVKFVAKPGKVCMLSRTFLPNLVGAYGEELYKASRIAFDELYG
ncbi:MAG: uroporphyrinogen decarboxylase family protein [Firmicutes bacterium]|nr:uroporphyrinogen decarboxylase family protein [Bacillota bacterium]